LGEVEASGVGAVLWGGDGVGATRVFWVVLGGRKRLFFEKKKQKTFPIGVRTAVWTPMDKSFLLLFFKKEALP
jgi:hypothetical protein